MCRTVSRRVGRRDEQERDDAHALDEKFPKSKQKVAASGRQKSFPKQQDLSHIVFRSVYYFSFCETMAAVSDDRNSVDSQEDDEERVRRIF